MQSTSAKSFLDILLFAWVALFLSAFLHVSLFPYCYDDAYIHFRVARNFAEHGLPYFNIDEAVMSSSSTLWTLVLSLVYRIQPDLLPLFVSMLNAVLLVGSALVWGFWISRVGKASILYSLPIALLLVGACTIKASIGLMETQLGLFLAGCGVLLFAQARTWAFFFLGAACFTRPEFSLLLFALAVLNLMTHRISWRGAILPFLLGIAGEIVYDFHFFSTLIPNTVHAKSIVYQVSASDFSHLLFYSLFNEDLAAGYKGLVPFYILLLMLTGMAILFVPQQVNDNELAPETPSFNGDIWAVFSFGVLLLLSYAARSAFLFPWYVPLFTLPVVMSLCAFCMRRKSWSVFLCLLVLVSPLLLNFGRTFAAAYSSPSKYADFLQGARVRKYLELGATLAKKYPDATLLSAEVGALGYSFPGKIFDAVGLISPAALKYHPMKVPDERASGIIGAIPPGYVQEVQPKIIVSYDYFMKALKKNSEIEKYDTLQEPAFLWEDQQALGAEASIWGDSSINVLVRR